MKLTALTFEKLWPYLAAGALTAAWWFGAHGSFPDRPEGLLGAAGGASAVLVGFLATAKTVILGLSGSAVIIRLKEAGYQTLMFRYLYAALNLGFLLLIASVIGFFLVSANGLPTYYEILWVSAASMAAFAYWRVTHLLFKVLRWV